MQWLRPKSRAMAYMFAMREPNMRLSPHFMLPRLALFLGLAACQASEEPSTSNQVSRAAADTQTTLEEDFNYPGAEAYTASGITLKKGDGNLLIVNCATEAYVIKVESFEGTGEYCFSVRGQSAYVTLEVSGVFLIWTDNAALQAKLTVGGQQSVLDLQQGYNPVGFGPDGNVLGATLLELRL
jgi:hypothetical protein